jgi:hypothetical protein
MENGRNQGTNRTLSSRPVVFSNQEQKVKCGTVQCELQAMKQRNKEYTHDNDDER